MTDPTTVRDMRPGPTDASWTRANRALHAYHEADEAAKVAADQLYAEVHTLCASGARPAEISHRLGVTDSWVRWVLKEKGATPPG